MTTVLIDKVFKKNLVDTCPILGPLIPLFWTSGDVSSGFQSQGGQPYSHLAVAYVIDVPRDLKFEVQ